MAPEDVVTKGMDMGDVLGGDSVEKTVTITNTGFASILTSQLSLIAEAHQSSIVLATNQSFACATCSSAQLFLQLQQDVHRWFDVSST